MAENLHQVDQGLRSKSRQLVLQVWLSQFKDVVGCVLMAKVHFKNAQDLMRAVVEEIVPQLLVEEHHDLGSCLSTTCESLEGTQHIGGSGLVDLFAHHSVKDLN